MIEKNLQIELSGYDLKGPELDENIASISFIDPSNKKATFCVGFKFHGGDLKNPTDWTYDHTNYWTPEILEDDSIITNLINKERVSKALNHFGQTIQSLLETYCDLIEQNK